MFTKILLSRDESMAALTTTTSYQVFLDENWDYCMQSGGPFRACVGNFDTYDQAVACAKGIVNGNLSDMIDQGKTAEEALLSWSIQGREPFIRPAPPPAERLEHFSARNYARQRSADIVDGLAKVVSKHERTTPLAEELGASGQCEMSQQETTNGEYWYNHDEDDDYDGFSHHDEQDNGEEEWVYDDEPSSQHSTRPIPLHQLKQSTYFSWDSPMPAWTIVLLAALLALLFTTLVQTYGQHIARDSWLGYLMGYKPRSTRGFARVLAAVAQTLREGTCHQFLFCEQ